MSADESPSAKRRQFSLSMLLRLVIYCAIVAAFINWIITGSGLAIIIVIVFYGAIGLLVYKLLRMAIAAIRRRGGD